MCDWLNEDDGIIYIDDEFIPSIYGTGIKD